MLPRIQLDDQLLESPMLYVTNASQLALVNVDDVGRYVAKKGLAEMDSFRTAAEYAKKSHVATRTNINSLNTPDLFNFQDIRDFKKKNNVIVSFSEYLFNI
jgi:hypothetical protein